MAYEILNREVSDSLDPQDPEFQQVQVQIRHIHTYMQKNFQEGSVVKVLSKKLLRFLFTLRFTILFIHGYCQLVVHEIIFESIYESLSSLLKSF